MNQNILNCLPIAFLCTMLVACGGEVGKKGDRTSVAELIPEKIANTELSRSSEPRLFVGDSLWEYINGGAEVYHTYGFAEVATADFSDGNLELVIDLFRFRSSEMAWGMYSYLRPDQPATVPLGIQGFVSGQSIDFVKGSVLVKITAFEESDEIKEALLAAAGTVEALLSGTTGRPAAFDRFPTTGIIPFTDKFIVGSFLGREYLDSVYTQSYTLDGDTLTLLTASDAAGVRFAGWSEATADKVPTDPSLGFDNDYGFVTTDAYYGDVLVGLRSGRLYGVLNYSAKHSDFVSSWLNSGTM